MNVFRLRLRLRRRLGRLLAGAGALLAMLVATGTAALAQVLPPSVGDGLIQPPLAPAPAGGMPGWQITLIAVGAALVAAVLAVLVDRARSGRVRPAVDPSAAGNAPARVSGAR
jgi:hypothetical protein